MYLHFSGRLSSFPPTGVKSTGEACEIEKDHGLAAWWVWFVGPEMEIVVFNTLCSLHSMRPIPATIIRNLNSLNVPCRLAHEGHLPTSLTNVAWQ